MFGPTRWCKASDLAPTQLESVCHRSGARVMQRLEGGHLVASSHPDAKVCFAAPLREWYDDLIAT
jgi:hypothetical protein